MEQVLVDGIAFDGWQIPLPTSALLVIRGRRGILGCGYLAVETADKLGHALAVVTGVKSFAEMLVAPVCKVSAAAAAVGVVTGMSGQDALKLMEQS